MDKDKREYLILLVVFILICLLVLLIVILINNINLIKQDAIIYGMERHGFSQCNCLDSNSQYVNINLGKLNRQTIDVNI
jgi:hypothetical protein